MLDGKATDTKELIGLIGQLAAVVVQGLVLINYYLKKRKEKKS